MELEEYS